jgi:hypothetical protein
MFPRAHTARPEGMYSHISNSAQTGDESIMPKIYLYMVFKALEAMHLFLL